MKHRIHSNRNGAKPWLFISMGQRGFSMIELMFAIALLSLITIAMLQLFSSQLNTFVRLKRLANRDQVVDMIKRNAGQVAALRSSFMHPSNSAFRACVDSGHPGPATCVHNVPVDFVLTDRGGVGGPPLFIPSPGTVVAGTTAAPIHYNEDGARCTPAPGNPKCATIVRTQFTPECPNGGVPSPCMIAQKVKIDYFIERDMTFDMVLGEKARLRDIVSGGAEHPSIHVNIPFAGFLSNAGGVNSMAMWSSSSTLAPSVISQSVNGDIRIAPVAAGALCNAGTPGKHGALRLLTGPVGLGDRGALEICDTNAIAPGWKWIAGPPDSAAMSAGALPILPGMYRCPGGGQVTNCPVGGLPPCLAQISTQATCCTAGAATLACTKMF